AAVSSRKADKKKKTKREAQQGQSSQNTPSQQAAPDTAPVSAPPAQPPPARTPIPPPPPQPKQVVIPSNTSLIIRMIDGVDSQVNRAGEIFHASLDAPLMVDDQVVVPKGADVYVRLSAASSAGHMTGKS